MMSFTSSLCECGSGSFIPAGISSFSLRDTYAFPFLGQPLVYYADGPELYNSKYNSQAKNKKPNYFVKAFQWYTQEHGGNKRAANEKREIGFAAWLDQKYEQYLWDVQLKGETLKSGVSSTVLSPTQSRGVATRKSDKPKGFQKILRSPWRKRRAAAKSPEIRNDSSECRPSWQIILRPKSMSRLASEICTQKVSLKWCATSKVSVASSDTQITGRTHSKKLGIVVQELVERPNYAADSDKDSRDNENSVTHNTSKSQHKDENCSSINNWTKNECDRNIKCECSVVPTRKIKSEKIYPNTPTSRHGKKKRLSVKNSKINVKCECPVVPNQVDANTQYGSNIFNTKGEPRGNNTTTVYGDKKSFSLKYSKTNVKCECQVAHDDPNIFHSEEKPLDNTTTTTCVENCSRAQYSKIDIICECPVVTQETTTNDNMVTQRNPNTVKTEENSFGQISTTRCTCKSSAPFEKSSNLLGQQHQGRQRPEGTQPRIHGAAQTTHNEITLSALGKCRGKITY